MLHLVALLFVGIILLVVATFCLATERALGSPPNFAPRHATRPETVDGCMTCVLAASGGDDILRRHLVKVHAG